jgi:hypothetical protein
VVFDVQGFPPELTRWLFHRHSANQNIGELLRGLPDSEIAAKKKHKRKRAAALFYASQFSDLSDW